MAADVAWSLLEPPALAARMATARPASVVSRTFCWLAIPRVMWCCVTCEISCASTLANCDSFCASRTSPVFTPTNPPGKANALICLIGDREEHEVLLDVPRGGDQSVAEFVQVIVDFRIFEVAAACRESAA